jgi:hypothetical protein
MKSIWRMSGLLVILASVFLSAFFSRADLTVHGPTFPATNTVRLTLTGAEATNAHLIFFTPLLFRTARIGSVISLGRSARQLDLQSA